MSGVRVYEYMSSPVIVVSPSDTITRARNLMLRYGIGRLPVVENGVLVGIITAYDIAKAIDEVGNKPLDTIPIELYMTRNPITVNADAPIEEAAKLMVKYGIGGLPVLQNGRLDGIITKSDIVRAFAEKLKSRYKVENYLDPNVPIVSPSHSIAYVAKLLFEAPCKRVLVVESGKLVGIIAPSDLAFAIPVQKLPRKAKVYKIAGVSPRGVYTALPYMRGVALAADIMTPNPLTVKPSDDLAYAARLMARHGFSSVPVVDDESDIRGIVVKHHILRALIAL
ncbi:MAG TPA: CBS domain-containing protein [Pyrodictium sp.]|nr:CBS domain-containing protein [Pyrodictium sp.]